jgi:hypothetical protein
MLMLTKLMATAAVLVAALCVDVAGALHLL